MKTEQENVQIKEMLVHLEKAFKVADSSVDFLRYDEEHELVHLKMMHSQQVFTANVFADDCAAVLIDSVMHLAHNLD